MLCVQKKETTRYVVLNGDESEPGTFKDREILMRRPDLVVEGLAIAAYTIGARDVYLYLRGEFAFPKAVMAKAVAEFESHNIFPDIRFHMHSGQGAYICGEETALLEALEGKRGMPRLRPPYPTEYGLWGKPTLIHNVENYCVRAFDYFLTAAIGFAIWGAQRRGQKCIVLAGMSNAPVSMSLPLGVTLDELVEEAGGYIGTPKSVLVPGVRVRAFCRLNTGINHWILRQWMGWVRCSARPVLLCLNDTVDIKWSVSQQLRFFSR